MPSTRNNRSSLSPPPLSRASTPDSIAPATPVLPSTQLHSSKMASQKPQVGFASPLATSAYRRPDWDERSVMRAFAQHATYCSACSDPMRSVQQGQTLCASGTGYAKDIGKYFFCWEGKPYSTVDRKHKGERNQVEVPVEYSVIKNLFEALSNGLKFSRPRPHPEVHQAEPRPGPLRASTLPEHYEIRPSRTTSNRPRSATYNAYNDDQYMGHRYEERSPYDARYRDSSDDKTHRDLKRGSLYVPETRRSKRKSYVVPTMSGWLR